mmetsp:Transcript_18877/g.53803  ORF Transcript_18877/g.53803 Transcript_18877/m.53803 type:complete len:233 (-) Transcript_18877:242-940(-)
MENQRSSDCNRAPPHPTQACSGSHVSPHPPHLPHFVLRLSPIDSLWGRHVACLKPVPKHRSHWMIFAAGAPRPPHTGHFIRLFTANLTSLPPLYASSKSNVTSAKISGPGTLFAGETSVRLLTLPRVTCRSNDAPTSLNSEKRARTGNCGWGWQSWMRHRSDATSSVRDDAEMETAVVSTGAEDEPCVNSSTSRPWSSLARQTVLEQPSAKIAAPFEIGAACFISSPLDDRR